MSSIVRSVRRTVDDMPWQDAGSCHGMDSGVFFHPDGERGRARANRIRRAKQICRKCRVLDMCRSYALRTEQPFGIWGGMSEQERQMHRAGSAVVAAEISNASAGLVADDAVPGRLGRRHR
ncbi:WhiB family transcriptional regulator [Nocardia sp. NPDC004722]